MRFAYAPHRVVLPAALFAVSGGFTVALAAASSSTASLRATGKVQGVLPVAANTTASLRGLVFISGTAVGTSTVGLSFDGGRYLAGAAYALASAGVTIKGKGAVGGGAQAGGAVGLLVKAVGAVHGNAAGNSASSGTLNVTVAVQGWVSAGAVTTCMATGRNGTSGAAQGLATGVANATGRGRLQGSATAPALPQVTLKGMGRLTGAANGMTVLSAVMTGVGGGATYDADSQAYFDAVTAVGGTLGLIEKNAVDAWVVATKADGTWGRMKGAYPFLGGVAAAVGINLRQPGAFTMTFPYADPVINAHGIYLNASQVGSLGTHPAEILGYAGNNNQEGHLSLYADNNATYPGPRWGAYQTATTSFRLQVERGTYVFSDNMGEIVGGSRIMYWGTAAGERTFFLANRRNATSHRLLAGGALLGEDTTDINGQAAWIPDSWSQMVINGRNQESETSNGRYQMATIGLGLTVGQEATLHNATQTFITAVGR